jgi:LmbE family N-acetylglucosaminyl deacetylase
MVIAPHADDAELAAYGLYSQADETWVVTLTAGEIEAEHYQQMGLAKAEAARLKGRLRAWDSIAVPRWAGCRSRIACSWATFCLQLPAMQAAPDQPAASREADWPISACSASSTRSRCRRPRWCATWHNLLADLRALLELAKPEVLVMPHPQLDPHPDHICAQAAVLEALQGLAWQPQTLLCYANHLHDNDRWPMGDSGDGVALPPQLSAAQAWAPAAWCWTCHPARQGHGPGHDARPAAAAPFKRRLRRCCNAGWPGVSRRLMGRTSSSARPCADTNCSGGVSCKHAPWLTAMAQSAQGTQ